RTRLTLSLKRALHEVEMRVRDFEPHLFEPGGPRPYDIRKMPGRLVHEQINADDQLCLVQALGDMPGIRERQPHGRTQKGPNLQSPGGRRLCDARHWVRDVASRRTPFRRAQVPEACAVRSMTWAKAAAGQAKIASQRRQAADRTGGVPGVGPFVHGATAE